MKKNKLFNGFLTLSVSIIFMFSSCTENVLEDSSITESNSSFDTSMMQRGTASVDVGKDIAETVALTFFSRTYNVNIANLSIKSEKDIEDYDKNKAIYAFDIHPSGFVLVSSNSWNVPIVAHSKNGTFDFDENSSDGLKSWLAENILFNDLLEKQSKSVEELDFQWYYLSQGRMPYPGDENGDGESPDHTVRYSHTVSEQFGPLLQTTWGQNAPYNNFTPNNWPTGCVAVATAQIMRYHEWPSNTFNWSIMPNQAFWNSAGALEIASLMSDIGANVNMNYSASGSGADSQDARNALVNNYGYSSTTTYSNYDLNTVKQEIKTYNRPVYLDGYHSYDTHGWWFWEYTTFRDGHAWVCDGYKQQYDVYIHNEGTQYEYTQQENRYEFLNMNWGWNNQGNGWFFRNNIYVGGVLISVDGNNVHPNFQYNRKCIYRIKP